MEAIIIPSTFHISAPNVNNVNQIKIATYLKSSIKVTGTAQQAIKMA